MEQTELIIVDALDKIEQKIYDSQIPRMRADDRLRIVNSDVIADMLADIKTQLPAEIRRANSLLLQMDAKLQSATDYANKIAADAEKNAEDTMIKANSAAQKATNEANEYYDEKVSLGDEYLANKMREGDTYYNERIAKAQEDAEAIIAQANEEREHLISEHEVTLAAQDQAEELRKKTIVRSNQVYNNAKKSADDVLATLMKYLEEYYNAIDADRKALDVKPAETEAKRPEQAARPQPQQGSRREAETDTDDNPPSFFDLFKRKKKPQNNNNNNLDYEDIN
jgi:hypothetical protein